MRGHWYFLGLISCLFSSLAVIEDSPTQGLRGVNNSQKEQLDFYSTDPFQCRDGTKLPGGSFVNDDYCDCPDGSDEPGTSACAGIHSSIEEAAPPPSPLFVCSSSSSSPLSEERITIPVSMVDDGVCDCCDGSDEKGTKCKDSCGTPIKSNAEKQKQMLRDNWRRKKEAVFGVAANVKGALEQQRAEILSAGRKITEMMAKGIQNSAARFQAQQKIQELRQRLQLTAMLLTADLGPHLASVQKCITSAPISEKLFAGGSKSYVAKEYVFIYCPFRHVLQSSVNLRQWVIANCMARMGAEPNSNEERICHAEGDRAIDLVPPIDYTGKIPRRDQGDDEEEEDFTGEMQKSRRRRAGKLGAERKKGEQSPPTLLGFWKSNGWGTNRSSNQSVEYAIFEVMERAGQNSQPETRFDSRFLTKSFCLLSFKSPDAIFIM